MLGQACKRLHSDEIARLHSWVGSSAGGTILSEEKFEKRRHPKEDLRRRREMKTIMARHRRTRRITWGEPRLPQIR